MNFKELFLIERIDQLIRLRTTGNPLNLANKLNISERHVYNIINKMKDVYKAPIEFDKDCNSYIYKETGRIVVGFHKETIPLNNLKKITGGKKLSLKFYFSELG
ncbi:hypothetical protein CYCD_20740 [Tenuifilaceae bacterium CYCD]|nr:hypothetical protein CYCD_20740 [Tenuifilaceae bacterium CYCD]